MVWAGAGIVLEVIEKFYVVFIVPHFVVRNNPVFGSGSKLRTREHETAETNLCQSSIGMHVITVL